MTKDISQVVAENTDLAEAVGALRRLSNQQPQVVVGALGENMLEGVAEKVAGMSARLQQKDQAARDRFKQLHGPRIVHAGEVESVGAPPRICAENHASRSTQLGV